MRVAERVQQALLSPFTLKDKEYVVTASIGIALASADHREVEDLLRDADIAMYRAKERGAGNWEIFDEQIRIRALKRVGIEQALRQALRAGELGFTTSRS